MGRFYGDLTFDVLRVLGNVREWIVGFGIGVWHLVGFRDVVFIRLMVRAGGYELFSRYGPQGGGDRGEPAVSGCGIDVVQAHEVSGGARGAY